MNDEEDEIEIKVSNRENGFRNAVSDIEYETREAFKLGKSKKYIILLILLAILALLFTGLAYFSKLYGEGNVSNVAAEYIFDKEVKIKNASGKGYYYSLGKDIVEKYRKALNLTYDSGEYDSKLLSIVEGEQGERINQNSMANETRGTEVEFNDVIFEEWFNTDDKKIWEEYLVKMFKTEIASGYPKLSEYEGESNTEDRQGTKKDIYGDYAVQGIVEIKRTSIGEEGQVGTTQTLEYIPQEKLAELIETNNAQAMNYYTFDEVSGYLYYATYTRRQLTADGHEYQSDYKLRRNWIQYRNLTSTFNMPFNFLLALLQTTENPEYVMAVADLLLNQTEITLMIQDQMEVTEESYVIENGVTVADKSWNNTANVFIQKAKTWCTDFEDSAEQDVTNETSEYINDEGRNVKKNVISYKWKINTVTEKRINHERFLGLWKNNTGTYTQGTLYDEKGREVAYTLPPDYTEKSYPARMITSTESGDDIDTLLDLLARYENTQTHEQLMRYFWNIYSGRNVYDIDVDDLLKIFNMGKFKTMLGATSYTLTIPEKVWYTMINAGYSKSAASSVVAEVLLYEEKEFKNSSENILNISEAQYAKQVDNGTYSNFVTDGVSYGLGKWSEEARKQGLLNYARSKGKSVSDVDIQIEYLVAELDISGNSEAAKYAKYQLGMYGDSWKNAKTPEEAAGIFYTACIKKIENMIDVSSSKTIISQNIQLTTYASSLALSVANDNDFIDYSKKNIELAVNEDEVLRTSNNLKYYAINTENGTAGKQMLIYLPGADNFSSAPEIFEGENAKNLDDTVVIVLDHQDNSVTNTMNAIKDIADKYNVDKDNIVIAGHSIGAEKAMQVANSNPGYFEKAIFISRTDLGTVYNPEGLTNTETKSVAHPVEGEVANAMNTMDNNINNNGGDASFEYYENDSQKEGHVMTIDYMKEETTWDWIHGKDETTKETEKRKETEDNLRELANKSEAKKISEKEANEYIENLDINKGTTLEEIKNKFEETKDNTREEEIDKSKVVKANGKEYVHLYNDDPALNNGEGYYGNSKNNNVESGVVALYEILTGFYGEDAPSLDFVSDIMPSDVHSSGDVSFQDATKILGVTVTPWTYETRGSGLNGAIEYINTHENTALIISLSNENGTDSWAAVVGSEDGSLNGAQWIDWRTNHNGAYDGAYWIESNGGGVPGHQMFYIVELTDPDAWYNFLTAMGIDNKKNSNKYFTKEEEKEVMEMIEGYKYVENLGLEEEYKEFAKAAYDRYQERITDGSGWDYGDVKSGDTTYKRIDRRDAKLQFGYDPGSFALSLYSAVSGLMGEESGIDPILITELAYGEQRTGYNGNDANSKVNSNFSLVTGIELTEITGKDNIYDEIKNSANTQTPLVVYLKEKGEWVTVVPGDEEGHYTVIDSASDSEGSYGVTVSKGLTAVHLKKEKTLFGYETVESCVTVKIADKEAWDKWKKSADFERWCYERGWEPKEVIEAVEGGSSDGSGKKQVTAPDSNGNMHTYYDSTGKEGGNLKDYYNMKQAQGVPYPNDK